MRYLGKVIEKLPDVKENVDKFKALKDLKMNGDFNHIKTILEREVLMRSAKHVFNRILKEDIGEGELHLAQIVSHLLNCLLAPTPFHAKLNSGEIKLTDDSIQNSFDFFQDAVISSPRRGNSVSDKHISPGKKEPGTEVSNFEDSTVQASEDRPDESGLTKAQRKRLRAKQKKAQSVSPMKKQKVEKKKEVNSTHMADILFKHSETVG